MTAPRSIFYGFGAYVGSQTGTSTCGFWADDPVAGGFNPAMLISVDLAKNPQAHRTGTLPINQIQVDDHTSNTTPGRTQIGPLWPSGTTIGGVWLESNFYNQLGANKPPRIPSGFAARDYEFTMALEWAGNVSGRRFAGVHAEITQVAGLQALTTIWNPGTSLAPNSQPRATVWLDLAAVASPIADGLTTIGIGPAEPKVGALFLDVVTAATILFDWPKLPKALGFDVFPWGE